MGKVVVVTACGSRKVKHRAEACSLYKSPRIRYICKICKNLQVPVYILSAKYGLVNGFDFIEPYDMNMTEERCDEIIEQIKEILQSFEVIVYYKGGANRIYHGCMYKAVKDAGKEFISFGCKNTKDIGKLKSILVELLEGG